MTHVCAFRKLPLTDIYVYLVKGLIDIICFLNILLLQIFSYKDIRFFFTACIIKFYNYPYFFHLDLCIFVGSFSFSLLF